MARRFRRKLGACQVVQLMTKRWPRLPWSASMAEYRIPLGPGGFEICCLGNRGLFKSRFWNLWKYFGQNLDGFKGLGCWAYSFSINFGRVTVLEVGRSNFSVFNLNYCRKLPKKMWNFRQNISIPWVWDFGHLASEWGHSLHPKQSSTRINKPKKSFAANLNLASMAISNSMLAILITDTWKWH